MDGGQGYLAPAYAEALAEFGTLLHMPRSGGYLLRRQIPGTAQDDAMGLYPLFCCNDWNALGDDLAALDPGIVSAVLVPDPFGDYAPDLLADTFDVVRPYSERYVAKLDVPTARLVSTHHRKCAAKGLAQLQVETCARPQDHLDEWLALYKQIRQRHRITDIRAFSTESFRRQLRVPGLAMFRARHEGRTVAIHLWMTQGRCAYGHLAGHDKAAYGLNAAYALYWHALESFRGTVELVDLGATTGDDARARDGLAYFKKGWATGTRMSYICGRVLKADAYAALTARMHPQPTGYFPAYRAPSSPPADS